MNNRKAKQIRKKVKQYDKQARINGANELVAFVKSQSLLQRIKFAWRVIRNK